MAVKMKFLPLTLAKEEKKAQKKIYLLRDDFLTLPHPEAEEANMTGEYCHKTHQ